jgi:hypothetical protein
MGNFVAAHVVRTVPTAELLDLLPAFMSWAAYREPATGAVLIDVFGANTNPQHPFSRLPRFPDIAQELPDTLAPLNRLYETLLAQRRASDFRRKYINLNLLLSRAIGMPVLSFASDDDGLDLACLSVAGQLHRLRFETDALDITWTDGRGVIQPLLFDDDDVTPEADLLALKSLSEFRLLVPQEQIATAHRIALEECRAFLRTAASILGLGTGDGHGDLAPAFMRDTRR